MMDVREVRLLMLEGTPQGVCAAVDGGVFAARLPAGLTGVRTAALLARLPEGSVSVRRLAGDRVTGEAYTAPEALCPSEQLVLGGDPVNALALACVFGVRSVSGPHTPSAHWQPGTKLVCTARGSEAQAEVTAAGVLVKAGSRTSPLDATAGFLPVHRRLMKELVDDGRLVKSARVWVFQTDVPFKSAAIAAALVTHGRASAALWVPAESAA